MSYKTKIRIPTDMYAYIEVDYEGTVEEVAGVYNEFVKSLKPQVGLSAKDWNVALDRYLKTNVLLHFHIILLC
jgi:hypothetical protein